MSNISDLNDVLIYLWDKVRDIEARELDPVEDALMVLWRRAVQLKKQVNGAAYKPPVRSENFFSLMSKDIFNE